MPEEKNKNESAKEKPKISGLRTFRSDAEEYVKGGKVSLAQILSQKRETVQDTHDAFIAENRKRVLGYAGAGMLVLILVAGGYFAFFNRPADETAIPEYERPAVRVSKNEIVNIRNGADSVSFLNTWNELRRQFFGPRNFVAIHAFNESRNKFLDAFGFLNLFNIAPPSNIISTMTGSYTTGFLDGPKGNEFFLIVEVDSFEEVFAGMLSWEKSMPRPFLSLMNQSTSLDAGNNLFEDKIVANHDSRVLKNTKNETIFAYAVFNRKFLVFAQNELSLEIIIRQLSVI